MGLEFAEQIDWVFNVRRRFCWFVEYFQIMGTNKDTFRKVLGIDFSYSNMKKDADYNEFTDPQEDARSFGIIEAETRRNFVFLHGIAEKSYRKSELLVSTAKKIAGADYKEMSLPEIKILFDEIALELMEYQPIIFMVFPVEKYLEEKLKKEIKKISFGKGLQEKFDECLCVFSRPKAELALISEEKALLNLAIAKKEGKNIDAELQKHIWDFAWIPADGPAEKPWSRNDFLNRINEMIGSDPKQKLEQILEGEEKRENDFAKYVEELGLDEKTVELIGLVRDFVYLRNYRAECWSQATYKIRVFLEFIAKKAGLSLDELIALGSNEISDFLGTGKTISKKEIKERMKAYAYIKINGEYEAYFGEEAQKIWHKEEKQKKIVAATELSGNTANRGKVVGIVRVVKELSDLSKVKKGDILVASMTVPQYIPAMEKAAAFVTDEGGITCHAAIVSRELDVPCIVGTGNASKVLKDGDLVEVNADEGTVKILKAAGE